MKKTEEVPVVRFLAKRLVGVTGVEFVLGNGESLAAVLADYPQAIRDQLMVHGLSQKVGDSAAGCAKDKAYSAALAAMTATHEALKAGKWGSDREATGGQLIADLISAIAKLKKMDAEAVGGAVRVADEATIKAWLKNVKIDAELKDIRAKRAKLAAKDAAEDFEFTV